MRDFLFGNSAKTMSQMVLMNLLLTILRFRKAPIGYNCLIELISIDQTRKLENFSPFWAARLVTTALGSRCPTPSPGIES